MDWNVEWNDGMMLLIQVSCNDFEVFRHVCQSKKLFRQNCPNII